MLKRTIDDYKNSEWVEYFANGIRIIKDIQLVIPPDKDPVNIGVFVVMVCKQGKMTITINDQSLKLTRNQVLVVQPNSVARNYHFSENFVSRTLVFSRATIENSIFLRKKIWDNISYLRMHPIISLSADWMRLFRYYYNIATNKINAADSLYRQEINNHLLRCVIYEFLLITDSLLGKESKYSGEQLQNSNDDLFRRFREQLAFSHGRIRKVEQFASQLFVTPDQLTAAVKAVSGRTTLEWITEVTVKVISYELLYTQKSIKEICKELNFSSISFFGNYFKQHTGYSPRAFRQNLGQGLPEQ